MSALLLAVWTFMTALMIGGLKVVHYYLSREGYMEEWASKIFNYFTYFLIGLNVIIFCLTSTIFIYATFLIVGLYLLNYFYQKEQVRNKERNKKAREEWEAQKKQEDDEPPSLFKASGGEFCRSCGCELDVGAAFCSKCGSKNNIQVGVGEEKTFDWTTFIALIIVGSMIWIAMPIVTIIKFMKHDKQFRMYLIATIISFICSLILTMFILA